MVVRRYLDSVQMERKGLPIPQDTLKVMDKMIFADNLRQWEHQRDMRRDQADLRVIFFAKLIDLPAIDVWVMNQCEEHSCQHSNAARMSCRPELKYNGKIIAYRSDDPNHAQI
jgi:hypothetical protein